jgi:predicted DNA-binding ribbon-helix-helix protein
MTKKRGRPKSDRKTISVGIRLEPKDWENLNHLAASLGMTRTELITQISRVQNPQDLQEFQKAKYLGESSAN